MPLLFIDYTNLVLKSYEEKRESNTLSRLLMHPTTANLRQECLNVFNEKIITGKLEEDILRSFFGVPPSGKNFDYVIERYHADKFRPLRSLIKRRIKNPALITVELLAWLIDFKPRPFAYAQIFFASAEDNIPKNEGGNIKVGPDNNALILASPKGDKYEGETEPTTIIGGSETTGYPRNKIITKNNKWKWMPLAGLIPVLVLLSIYGARRFAGAGQSANGNSNATCMYWSYDRYIKIPCSEDRRGRLFLPLDEKLLNGFRMITRKDTITQWSVGRIYYIKDHNQIKYFTSAGTFPEDLKRSLRILSPYIFEKDSLNRKIPD